MLNPILSTSNTYASATYGATPDAVKQLPGLPLGVSASGEIFVKTDSAAGASTVTVEQAQYSGTAAFATPTGSTVATTAITIAAGEIGFIQNLAAAALYVKYGTGASSTSLSYILKGGDAAADGLGGSAYINDHIGVVTVAPASGTSNYVAWKDS